ncbi:TlpA disulfide reductase family protein [uncultured Algibacter sp.]|uniref:TlpA family protein disulfide reductase n=1 Tax=uncultured Algibacter sp. TaxID=298659 RepID=UPI0032167346
MNVLKMNLAKIILLTILLSSINSINLYAQNNESNDTKIYLKGLTKASENDLSDQEIALDGESIPVYDIKGERIRGMEMMKAMVSGDYKSDYYIDTNKEIKAIVLRFLTEDEKKQMEDIQGDMGDKSELIGTKAPAFVVTDINGNEYSLNSLKGKIIVMNFWYIACKPCVMEMPDLNKLVKDYKSKDVVFIGFATNNKEEVKSFLNNNVFSYNIIPNSKNIAKEYGVIGYPTHIIIDENSKIVYQASGLGSRTISDIEKTIEELIKK